MFLIQDAIESRLVHRAGERTETAVAEAVEAGQIGIADRHLLQGCSLLGEIRSFGGRYGTIDGFA